MAIDGVAQNVRRGELIFEGEQVVERVITPRSELQHELKHDWGSEFVAG